MNEILIKQWEEQHYPLSMMKKNKLMQKQPFEVISALKNMADMPAITKFGEVSEVSTN